MAKIGLIQLDNTMEGKVAPRQDAIIELAEKCLLEGADLVFFPEAFQYQCTNRDDKFAIVEKYAAAWQERCAALARKYHAYVVPWDYYVGDDGKAYNSSYILDRNGELVGRYCKCNLTYAEITTNVSHGMDIPVFDLDIGRVGMMICFDNYFPEVAATLGNKGAQLVLYPLFGDTLKPQWELKLRARAADHSFYVAPCQIDSWRKVSFTGMVDPEGNVIAKLEEDNSYLVVDIDIGKEVYTHTGGDLNKPGENLREYLHKCRNFAACKSLADPGTQALDWSEIYH